MKNPILYVDAPNSETPFNLSTILDEELTVEEDAIVINESDPILLDNYIWTDDSTKILPPEGEESDLEYLKFEDVKFDDNVEDDEIFKL
ncbi:hypothetical protein C6P40_004725 [Pichia californica]|uniref:Uncharacterized protein n=1 Tax=Pichia californica TaxID=460514 RepID=A0A9P7BDN8_9ASCO|nr:hypothetical protein C6P40_004725 [[Candida] californica]